MTKNMDIRSASSEDGSFLAWAIFTAGRAHVHRSIWEVVLRSSAEECVSFLKLVVVTEKPHLFHYSGFLVAEVNQRPAAALSGYDPRVLGYHALRQALPEVFAKMGLTESTVEPDDRAGKVLACIPEPLPGAWMINNVATLPEFRGRCLASQLLRAIVEKGRGQGFAHAEINQYIGNTAAQRIYERNGFKEIDQKRDPVFEAEIGSPGMVRLVRDL